MILLLLIVCAGLVGAQSATGSDGFAREVQPILTKNCLGCHNEKLKLSGFSMTSRESLLAGGKRGPAVVPGDIKRSKLVMAIRHEGTPQMPPGRKLAEGDIRIIEQWIAGGAHWPSNVGMPGAAATPNHWSFIPPRRPAEPRVSNTKWVRTPIDRFILARLEENRITPSPVAAKSTLLRRVHLDLTGLPPAPEEVRAFENDKSPNAWNKVIDKLLASPHFGERWGRKWLDQARYADSDGGSRDEPRQIWRYRDWVINALNADMPFDRFVIEQLAGDLLPNPTKEQLTATGFHRNSMIQIEAGTDREQYRTEAVFDRTDTTGTVFLGLSVGCAKCHDHKYDPISQSEYYGLYAFFNNTDDWDNSRPSFRPEMGNLQDVHGPVLFFSSPADTARYHDLMTQMKEAVKGTTEEDGAGGAAAKERLEKVRALKSKLPPVEWTLIMRELEKPRETHILLGGDYLQKGERVHPGTPAFLHLLPTRENANRLDFAKWLVDPANPLLARVTVNRIWQEYFGRGLVETENDFGTQGTPPSHPELLDWLATELIRTGWSQKAIHRLIVNSAVYRQSSASRPDLAEIDPRNTLLARQTRLRLDAEIVRDVALSASGLLISVIGGPSVFPPQPAAAMEASQVKKTWTASTGPDRYRRGMYTFFWRVTPNPELVVFDAPGAMTTCTRRDRSNTPLQALTLLNDTAFHEFAQALGLRLIREEPNDIRSRIIRGFRLVVARQPQPRELTKLQEFVSTESDHLGARPDEVKQLVSGSSRGGIDDRELAVWTSFARVLFNTDEFITRE